MKKITHLMTRVFELFFFRLFGGVAYARKVGVTVGNGCRIYTSQFGSDPELIEIGNKVTLTHGVNFLTHDGSTWLFRDENGRRYLYNKIVIGSEVFIGINSILMPGVQIGNNVIIGAGSVVTKSVPDGWVVAGNPARKIAEFDQLKNKALSDFLSEGDLNQGAAKLLPEASFKPMMKE